MSESYDCPPDCGCQGVEPDDSQQNSDAIPLAKPCAFCDADTYHAWHDDGSWNEQFEAGEDAAPPVHNPPLRKREGDPRFLALLDEIEALHARKQRDYGREHDPFANVRASIDWGVPAWIGGMIRATDKVKRLQTYAVTGSLSNEGVEDSLLDLAVYSLICLILFREEPGEG